MLPSNEDSSSSESLSLGRKASIDTSSSQASQLAPEVDYNAYAPQLYPLPEGLQNADTDGLEFAFNTDAPEPAPDTNPPCLIDNVGTSTRSHRKFGRRWLLFMVPFSILAIAVGAGLGVGLGVGLQRQHSLDTLPSTDSSGQSTTTPAVPSPTSPVLVNGAMKDTSLASVTTANNDRHLFFQDINSTLRHAIYSTSQDTWLSSVDFLITPQRPRNGTPIAVLDASAGADPGLPVNVYFVDENNNLAAVQFPPTMAGNLLNNSFFVFPETRSLSVVQLPSSDQTFLFYESPYQNVTVLEGMQTGPLGGIWIWNNVSDIFNAQNFGFPSEGWFGAPFSAAIDEVGELNSFFFNPQSTYNSTVSFILELGSVSSNINASSSLSFRLFSYGITKQYDDDGIISKLSTAQIDLLCLGQSEFSYVINNTLQSAFDSPKSSFPFSRMASVNVSNTVYVQHQLNESVLLEEILDTEAGTNGWGDPKVIQIPTN